MLLVFWWYRCQHHLKFFYIFFININLIMQQLYVFKLLFLKTRRLQILLIWWNIGRTHVFDHHCVVFVILHHGFHQGLWVRFAWIILHVVEDFLRCCVYVEWLSLHISCPLILIKPLIWHIPWYLTIQLLLHSHWSIRIG